MFKKIALLTSLFCAFAAHADGNTKKELIDKLLLLQQPAIDVAARDITEQQPMQMGASAQRVIMQNVPDCN